MNLNKKPLLYAAILAGMGIVPVHDVLATPLNYAPGDDSSDTPNIVYIPIEAKESASTLYSVYNGGTGGATVGSLVSSGGDLDVYVYTMPGYAVKVGEQKTLVVKVSLTGGAKFSQAPILVCPHSGLVAAGGAASTRDVDTITWAKTVAATDVTGVIGAFTETGYFIVAINQTKELASYSFAFPEGFVIPEANSGACILSLAAGDPHPASVSAVKSIIGAPAGTNISMVVETTYDEFFTKVIQTATIPLVTFATAFKAEISTKNLGFSDTGAYATIDVGSLSKKFISGSDVLSGAFVGHVAVTALTAQTFRAASGAGLSATDMIETVSISVSGPTISSLSRVTFSEAGALDCGAALALYSAAPAVNATSGSTSGSSSSVGSVTVTVATANVNYAALVSGSNGYGVCLLANGNNPLSNGYLSISVNGTSPTGKALELGSSNDYLEVKRNGTAVRVLNVPLESSDPYKVNIRMFNTSNQELTGVKGSLYGVDGTLIKDGLDLGTVPPNALKLVTSDSVIGMLGTGSTAKGRAWMLIQAPVQDTFKVQVLMKNPTGVLSNISTDAVD